MRSSLLLPALLVLGSFLGGSLCAQDQERKLEQRILKPDMSKPFNLEKAPFGGKRAYQGSSANVKEFYAPQRYGPREYQAKDFTGSKGSWFGNAKFNTESAAPKGKFEIPNATRKADTKTLAVDDARESSKTMKTSKYATGEITWRGRSQDKLDSEKGGPGDSKPLGYSGDFKVMSIDDVRELLNKNK